MAANPLSKSRSDVTYLRPTHGLAALNLRDLWVYRELVLFLTWRDILVRYKQTVLGAAWAVIQPIVQMVVFTFIFSNAAGFSSEGVPYPIFNFTALLTLGVILQSDERCRTLAGHQSQYDHEDLFSPPDHPGGIRPGRHG